MNVEEIQQEINNLSKEDIEEILCFATDLLDSLEEEAKWLKPREKKKQR